MSDFLKVSGKRTELPAPAKDWTFNVRPGGWVIAERKTATGTERKRVAIHEAKGGISFSIDGFLYQGQIQTPTRGAAGGGGSDADLVAQFPGKVRKILAPAGTKVEEGTPLVLVEAMKMEFAVKAPFAGTVEKVLVSEGQQLSPGTRFVDLKPLLKKES